MNLIKLQILDFASEIFLIREIRNWLIFCIHHKFFNPDTDARGKA